MAARSQALDLLLARLAEGSRSSAELEQALGRSQTWVNEALRALMADGRVLRAGSRRGARYGLRREVVGAGSEWPLHRIDRAGEPRLLGTIRSISGDEYFIESATDGPRLATLSPGLPYFLQDQRPAGFLGRAVPRQYPDLDAPDRVQDWSDEHYLRYLTNHGSDTVGDLILGRAAFDRYVAATQRPVRIDAAARATEYPRLADEALRGGLAGSSPHGEHPKFAITLEDSGVPRPVLVKFSPPIGRPVGERWSDLLVAEHLALETLRAAGIPAAASRIHRAGNRTFLEVDRFDRTTAGRVGVTSLLAIGTCLLGRIDPWIPACAHLLRERRIAPEALEQIRFASAFGDLIGNTDKHAGNLAFFDGYDGHFSPAPVYDMLPMLHAPDHEELVAREFEPAPPSTETLGVWASARTLAERYWRTLVSDERVSGSYRALAGECLATLDSLPRTGPFAPAAGLPR